MPRSLLPHHREELRKSGLTDATIDATGIYSETDPVEIARLLNWSRPVRNCGAALVFPFFNLDGTPSGFARVKLDKPRTGDEGKTVKYEQPRGVSLRPYFPLDALAAIRDGATTLLITEGEKKSLAATQAGVPTIGLTGVWAWCKKMAGDDERELLDALAHVVASGRRMAVMFDTDPRRNPQVNHAGAEFARVLESHGATVVLIDLPLGTRGADGLPGKMGVDDFIVAHGAEKFCKLVADVLRPPAPPRELADWRRELEQRRVESVDKPGLYLDRSPPGSGKSFADVPACRKAGKSLTVVPSHKNAEQVEELLIGQGLNAVAYPKLDKDSCQNLDEANAALDAGRPPSSAVCPGCKFRDGCDYRYDIKAADATDHRISTHARAERCLDHLCEGRRYISIHEDPSDLLRPVMHVADGFESVAALADAARWYVDDTIGQPTDEQGNKIPGHKESQRWFFEKLARVALDMNDALPAATKTARLPLPKPAHKLIGVERVLWAAIKAGDIRPPAVTLQLCLAVAAGEVSELAVTVNTNQITKQTHRSIVGVWRTELPANATIWIADATTTAADAEMMAGRPVIDATPSGGVNRQHDVAQIVHDITKATSKNQVVALLAAVLDKYPQARRVGVICHSGHKKTVLGTARHGNRLDAARQARIVKVEHYRCGESRGANNWLDECDLLVCSGTPRVPPEAIQARLLRLGRVDAATRDGEWVRDYWTGRDERGRLVTVRGWGYRDRDWHAAYRAIVAAELVQAVGRGRSICEHGIPVVVVSNEPLGHPLIDLSVLTAAELKILETMIGLCKPSQAETVGESGATGQSANICNSKMASCAGKQSSVATWPVSTASIANAVGLHERWMTRVLNRLAAIGLVEKVGRRGGWIPCQPASSHPPPSVPFPAPAAAVSCTGPARGRVPCPRAEPVRSHVTESWSRTS